MAKTKLCCLLNAEYKCSLCGAVVCGPCNILDRQNNRGYASNLNKLGHLKKSCITSRALACGWEEIE